MPSFIRTGLTLGIVIAVWANAAPGFFQDATDGARPAGMGEAFTAIADDANAVLYNPAGFARIDVPQLSGMYSNLYTGLNPILYTGSLDRLGYNTLAAAIPVSAVIGYFGAAWVQLQSEVYQENTFILSYARRAWDAYPLDWGVNLKLLSWAVRAGEGMSAESRTRFTLDAGLLANPLADLQVGAAVDNCIPADMGVDETEWVPWNFRLGAAYLFRFPAAPVETLRMQLEWAARDVAYDHGNFNLKLGLEATLLDKHLAVRTGVNRDVLACGVGVLFPWLGCPWALQADYAYTFPFELRYNYGSHRIGLTLCGNRPETAAPLPATPEPAPEPMAVATPGPAPELTTAPQVETELEQKLQEMQKKIEVGELRPVYFDTNKSTIKPESFPTLNYLGGILAAYPSLRVSIEGHTDSQGEASYNKRLSQSRVESAKQYLAAKFRITPDNLVPVGYGLERPIADNATPEGRAKNRRVEFHVIVQNEAVPATNESISAPHEGAPPDDSLSNL